MKVHCFAIVTFKALSLTCACLICQRLHVFLFELALVLSRPSEDRDGGHVFHVYRQPLPNASINLEEIPDGEASGGGTFRGAFTGGNDKGNITNPQLTVTLVVNGHGLYAIYDYFNEFTRLNYLFLSEQ